MEPGRTVLPKHPCAFRVLSDTLQRRGARGAPSVLLEHLWLRAPRRVQIAMQGIIATLALRRARYVVSFRIQGQWLLRVPFVLPVSGVPPGAQHAKPAQQVRTATLSVHQAWPRVHRVWQGVTAWVGIRPG